MGFNYKTRTIKINNKAVLFDFPLVMGIINITPDSFYSQSRKMKREEILVQAEKMIKEGASILDLGAYSSRPGAIDISLEEEMNRLIPAIKNIRQHFPEIIISVDTFRSEVARAALDAGASMINDISAWEMDEKMFELVIEKRVPYLIMHMKGTPQTMQNNPQYENVVAEIYRFLGEKIQQLTHAGHPDVLIDPGFGFGKTLQHNYQILKNLDIFRTLERPIVVGLSRKSMIYRALDITPEEALNGTTALHTLALLKGADILRTHDVKEAMEVIKLVSLYLDAQD